MMPPINFDGWNLNGPQRGPTFVATGFQIDLSTTAWSNVCVKNPDTIREFYDKLTIKKLQHKRETPMGSVNS